MRKTLFIIGILISGVCLYFAFRGLGLAHVAQAIGNADLRWVGVALLVYSGSFAVRSLRWRALLAPVMDIRASQLIRPLILGFFANNVLPFRMGELVRAHVTGRKFKISRSASLGTIVVERVFDTISFLLIFLTIASIFPFPAAIQRGAQILGGACLFLCASLWIAAAHQAKAHGYLERLPLRASWRSKIGEVITNFAQGISGLRRGGYLATALLFSIVVWILEGTTIYLIMRAFPVTILYPQAFYILFFLGLSVAIPQAPGYVGTVELFGTMALESIGIPREQGLPIIVTLHVAQFAFVGIAGLWALWKEGGWIAIKKNIPDDMRQTPIR